MVSNQNRRICTSLPNRLGTEKEAMALVESFLDGLGAGQARLDDLKTLVSEACLNAIEHGNGLDPAATYDVELEWEDGVLAIRVYDQGGAPWDGIHRAPDISSVMDNGGDPRGWGLRMIDALADAWSFRTSGDRACMEMKVRLPEREGGVE